MNTKFETKTLFLVITRELFEELKYQEIDIDGVMKTALLNSLNEE